MSTVGRKRKGAFHRVGVARMRKRARTTADITPLRRRFLGKRPASLAIVSRRAPLYNHLGTVFPAEYVTKVRYGATWNNDTASPALYDWILRGNGPYDPQYGAGGETATGWTQLAAIYGKHYCTGSTLEVGITNTDSTNHDFMCYIVPRTDSTSLIGLDHDQFKGHPGAVFRDNITIQDGSVHLVSSMSTKKQLGGLLDSTVHAATNATPSTEWFWHILTFPSGGATGFAASLVEAVTITYTVHFYALKSLDQAAF